MAKAIEGVNPTRMELLRLRRRVRLAEKGHRLLREKRDALISEFFAVVDRVREARRRAERALSEAFRSLMIAEMVMGPVKVEVSAMSVRRECSVDIESRNIMGVVVPVVMPEIKEANLMELGYGFVDTSPKLDEAAKKFEEALRAILELAEVEESLRRLAEEINKTKRRVNALEYIVIPRLRETVRYIRMKLDEMERESFVRLKKIKKKLEMRREEMIEAAA